MKAKILRIIKYFFFATGTFLIVCLILAFTSLPFWMRYHLGTAVPQIKNQKPDYIVMLGAGGIPEGKNMVRLYHTAKISKEFPKAHIIIALPGDTTDTLSSISLMKKELLIRNISKQRITSENIGNNTHNEVLSIKKIIGDTTKKILVVTSPEHLYRSVKCFQKAGFRNVFGHPAFERTLETDLLLGNTENGETEAIPEIGDNIQIRYRVWVYLQYEIMVFREYLAIAYYWIKGWI